MESRRPSQAFRQLFRSLTHVDPENKVGRYILDENGEPVPCPDLFQWGEWLEGHDKARIVEQTELKDGHRVSTVFLALDHNHAARAGIPGADPRPVLWETMVFNDYAAIESYGFTRRYCSRADAVGGHAEVIDEVTRWLDAGMPKDDE